MAPPVLLSLSFATLLMTFHRFRSAASPRAGRRSLRERGQATVEMVLVLPILILVLFAIIDFGISFNYWNDLNQIAANGARKAAVAGNTPFDPVSYVKAQAEPTLRNRGELAVAVCFPDGAAAVGNAVQIKATAKHRLLHLIPGLPGVTELNLSGQSTMRLEAPPAYAATGSC